jgi:hypothetical protein
MRHPWRDTRDQIAVAAYELAETARFVRVAGVVVVSAILLGVLLWLTK